jgi:hypothetical protein
MTVYEALKVTLIVWGAMWNIGFAIGIARLGYLFAMSMRKDFKKVS